MTFNRLALFVILNLKVMALINCPECNRKISEKASTCPHCGNPMNVVVPEKSMPTGDIDDKEYIFCPKCFSTHVHSEQQGFSGGKALVGAITVGAVGLLAGTIGSKKVQLTCLKCGCKFLAGEAFIATHKKKDEIIKGYQKVMLDKGELKASQYIQRKMNWNPSQADNFKKAYLKGHQDFNFKVKCNESERNVPKTTLGIIVQNLCTLLVVLFFLFIIMTIIWAIFDGGDFSNGFFITFSILSLLILGFVVKEIIIPDINRLKSKKKQ